MRSLRTRWTSCWTRNGPMPDAAWPQTNSRTRLCSPSGAESEMKILQNNQSPLSVRERGRCFAPALCREDPLVTISPLIIFSVNPSASEIVGESSAGGARMPDICKLISIGPEVAGQQLPVGQRVAKQGFLMPASNGSSAEIIKCPARVKPASNWRPSNCRCCSRGSTSPPPADANAIGNMNSPRDKTARRLGKNFLFLGNKRAGLGILWGNSAPRTFSSTRHGF